MGWLRVLKQQKLDAIEPSAFKEETKQLLMALILGERSELRRAWMNLHAQLRLNIFWQYQDCLWAY